MKKSYRSQTTSWLSRKACSNCKFYDNHYCYYHDTPACPFARCDAFKDKGLKERQKDEHR